MGVVRKKKANQSRSGSGSWLPAALVSVSRERSPADDAGTMQPRRLHGSPI